MAVSIFCSIPLLKAKMSEKMIKKFVFVPFFLIIPSFLYACAVCFSSTGKSIYAYYITTAAMTAIPLLLVGGLAFWFYRIFKNNDQETHPTSFETYIDHHSK